MQEKSWEDLNTKNYIEFINNFIAQHGQYTISEDGLYEMHHILPGCKGGEGDYINNKGKSCFKKLSNHLNCVYLPLEEHFIAHKILADDNIDDFNICSAYWRMATSKHYTAEQYAEARANRSKSMSIRMSINHPTAGKKLGPLSEAHKQAISKGNTGKKRSEEAKQHYRESKLGDKNPMKNIGVNHPMYGKHHTEEALERISLGRKGKCLGADNPAAKAVVCIETGWCMIL